LESPRTRSDFFPFAIHIINAAIIAFSFELVKDTFIPFELVKTFSDKVNFLTVLFVWGFLISGWLGYTKSISDKPHKAGHVGNLRFVIELIISFFMLYLFIIAEKSRFDNYFGSAFVWVIPAIFLLFVFWDLLKYKEYRSDDEGSNKNLQNRMLYTVYILVALLIQDFFYNLFIGKITIEVAFDKNTTTLWFLISSSVIIAIYRIIKGNISGDKVKTSE
jgi:hypothetical protein